MATISFNPVLTTNATGSFNVQSDGYIQGQAMDDPSARYRLAGGILATTETLPMWGGVGITEYISPASALITAPNQALGGNIKRALNDTAASSGELTGFSVFDQNYAAVTTPQSPVPLVGSGSTLNFYRLGSRARIAVAMDPALVSLEGLVITSQVSWDFTAQRLIPYLGTLTISSGTYNNTTGAISLTMSAPITFGVGDTVVLSSLTGTGAYASLNGTYTALTGTTGSTVVLAAAAALGAATITGGSLVLGSGASVLLPVKILNVNVGNSMTVVYDTVTGFATWNRSGSCALIQL
jgi:hypothetical protein